MQQPELANSKDVVMPCPLSGAKQRCASRPTSWPPLRQHGPRWCLACLALMVQSCSREGPTKCSRTPAKMTCLLTPDLCSAGVRHHLQQQHSHHMHPAQPDSCWHCCSQAAQIRPGGCPAPGHGSALHSDQPVAAGGPERHWSVAWGWTACVAVRQVARLALNALPAISNANTCYQPAA